VEAHPRARKIGCGPRMNNCCRLSGPMPGRGLGEDPVADNSKQIDRVSRAYLGTLRRFRRHSGWTEAPHGFGRAAGRGPPSV
jgi:hypothetical protein